ncbi:ABC transporter ATP-binding protein [Xylophilus sp. GW821-FHT01B05]
MLEIRNLQVHFGGIKALMGVDVSAQRGGIVSLLGANGAGKSTLLASIMGVCSGHATGSIHFEGEDISRESTERIVSRGIALCPEGRQLFLELSVQENLRMGAYLRRDAAGVQSDLERMYELFPRVRERRAQLAGTLSGGEQQMVAIARGLMSRPRLLLLDEPSLGLSPRITQDIMRLIQRINWDGVTVLLVEQNARQALRISSRAYVLEKGRVQMQGDARRLANDPSVLSAYLAGDD